MGARIYDLIIVGGGPAGSAAAVYAGRKLMKTLLITEEFGGQSVVSDGIQNWIGEQTIDGSDLAAKLEAHVAAQTGVEVRKEEAAVSATVDKKCVFRIATEKKRTYRAKALIVACGGHARRLGVPGEDRLNGKGVAYCSTCDAPLFKGDAVAVVGSGNAAIEAVVDLVPYARKIYLLIRGGRLKGDPVNRRKIENRKKVSVIMHSQVQEVKGTKTVTGLVYKDKAGRKKKLAVAGVFVQIGSAPNSGFVRDLVKTNAADEIVVDHRTSQASRPGVFAAGDVTTDPFKQNNIAAGDGVRAALSAYHYILNFKKHSPCAERDDG